MVSFDEVFHKDLVLGAEKLEIVYLCIKSGTEVSEVISWMFCIFLVLYFSIMTIPHILPYKLYQQNSAFFGDTAFRVSNRLKKMGFYAVCFLIPGFVHSALQALRSIPYWFDRVHLAMGYTISRDVGSSTHVYVRDNMLNMYSLNTIFQDRGAARIKYRGYLYRHSPDEKKFILCRPPTVSKAVEPYRKTYEENMEVLFTTSLISKEYLQVYMEVSEMYGDNLQRIIVDDIARYSKGHFIKFNSFPVFIRNLLSLFGGGFSFVDFISHKLNELSVMGKYIFELKKYLEKFCLSSNFDMMKRVKIHRNGIWTIIPTVDLRVDDHVDVNFIPSNVFESITVCLHWANTFVTAFSLVPLLSINGWNPKAEETDEIILSIRSLFGGLRGNRYIDVYTELVSCTNQRPTVVFIKYSIQALINMFGDIRQDFTNIFLSFVLRGDSHIRFGMLGLDRLPSMIHTICYLAKEECKTPFDRSRIMYLLKGNISKSIKSTHILVIYIYNIISRKISSTISYKEYQTVNVDEKCMDYVLRMFDSITEFFEKLLIHIFGLIKLILSDKRAPKKVFDVCEVVVSSLYFYITNPKFDSVNFTWHLSFIIALARNLGHVDTYIEKTIRRGMEDGLSSIEIFLQMRGGEDNSKHDVVRDMFGSVFGIVEACMSVLFEHPDLLFGTREMNICRNNFIRSVLFRLSGDTTAMFKSYSDEEMLVCLESMYFISLYDSTVDYEDTSMFTWGVFGHRKYYHMMSSFVVLLMKTIKQKEYSNGGQKFDFVRFTEQDVKTYPNGNSILSGHPSLSTVESYYEQYPRDTHENVETYKKLLSTLNRDRLWKLIRILDMWEMGVVQNRFSRDTFEGDSKSVEDAVAYTISQKIIFPVKVLATLFVFGSDIRGLEICEEMERLCGQFNPRSSTVRKIDVEEKSEVISKFVSASFFIQVSAILVAVFCILKLPSTFLEVVVLGILRCIFLKITYICDLFLNIGMQQTSSWYYVIPMSPFRQWFNIIYKYFFSDIIWRFSVYLEFSKAWLRILKRVDGNTIKVLLYISLVIGVFLGLSNIVKGDLVSWLFKKIGKWIKDNVLMCDGVSIISPENRMDYTELHNEIRNLKEKWTKNCECQFLDHFKIFLTKLFGTSSVDAGDIYQEKEEYVIVGNIFGKKIQEFLMFFMLDYEAFCRLFYTGVFEIFRDTKRVLGKHYVRCVDFISKMGLESVFREAEDTGLFGLCDTFLSPLLGRIKDEFLQEYMRDSPYNELVCDMFRHFFDEVHKNFLQGSNDPHKQYALEVVMRWRDDIIRRLDKKSTYDGKLKRNAMSIAILEHEDMSLIQIIKFVVVVVGGPVAFIMLYILSMRKIIDIVASFLHPIFMHMAFFKSKMYGPSGDWCTYYAYWKPDVDMLLLEGSCMVLEPDMYKKKELVVCCGYRQKDGIFGEEAAYNNVLLDGSEIVQVFGKGSIVGRVLRVGSFTFRNSLLLSGDDELLLNNHNSKRHTFISKCVGYVIVGITVVYCVFGSVLLMQCSKLVTKVYRYLLQIHLIDLGLNISSLYSKCLIFLNGVSAYYQYQMNGFGLLSGCLDGVDIESRPRRLLVDSNSIFVHSHLENETPELIRANRINMFVNGDHRSKEYVHDRIAPLLYTSLYNGCTYEGKDRSGIVELMQASINPCVADSLRMYMSTIFSVCGESVQGYGNIQFVLENREVRRLRILKYICEEDGYESISGNIVSDGYYAAMHVHGDAVKMLRYFKKGYDLQRYMLFVEEQSKNGHVVLAFGHLILSDVNIQETNQSYLRLESLNLVSLFALPQKVNAHVLEKYLLNNGIQGPLIVLHDGDRRSIEEYLPSIHNGRDMYVVELHSIEGGNNMSSFPQTYTYEEILKMIDALEYRVYIGRFSGNGDSLKIVHEETLNARDGVFNAFLGVVRQETPMVINFWLFVLLKVKFPSLLEDMLEKSLIKLVCDCSVFAKRFVHKSLKMGPQEHVLTNFNKLKMEHPLVGAPCLSQQYELFVEEAKSFKRSITRYASLQSGTMDMYNNMYVPKKGISINFNNDLDNIIIDRTVAPFNVFRIVSSCIMLCADREVEFPCLLWLILEVVVSGMIPYDLIMEEMLSRVAVCWVLTVLYSFGKFAETDFKICKLFAMFNMRWVAEKSYVIKLHPLLSYYVSRYVMSLIYKDYFHKELHISFFPICIYTRMCIRDPIRYSLDRVLNTSHQNLLVSHTIISVLKNLVVYAVFPDQYVRDYILETTATIVYLPMLYTGDYRKYRARIMMTTQLKILLGKACYDILGLYNKYLEHISEREIAIANGMIILYIFLVYIAETRFSMDNYFQYDEENIDPKGLITLWREDGIGRVKKDPSIILLGEYVNRSRNDDTNSETGEE